MSASDITSHAVKFATLMLGVLLLDYTLLDGRMLGELMIGFQRMTLDAPDVIPDILKSLTGFNPGR